MRDKASVMRDIIFNITRRKITIVRYHFIFWALFIFYEITLAAAIRERFNHFADYLLHYSLNILLFYVHCYIVIGNRQFNRISDYQRVFVYLLLEITSYYLFSVWINKFLSISGIPVNVSDSSSRLFLLAMLYRYIYIIGMSTAFRIALNLVKNKERIHKYITQNLIAEKEKATLRSELVSAELSFLRSQINPHFLFNSLNSIYNRIRKKDPVSAEYVMALADLMQYALQSQSVTDNVLLESELEHISNYMKLQRIRYSHDVAFHISIDDRDLKVIPFLLITLIENIFQHGDLRHEQIQPLIEISVSRGELVLRTRNSIRSDRRPGNGMGLTNTRKRLELNYRDKYILEYFAEQNIFHLKLQIKLK